MDYNATKDFRYLFDKETLKKYGNIYPENAQWNFQNLLVDKLLREEKAIVRGIQLQFPYVQHEQCKGTPFAFYTLKNTRTIEVPISSIKFLDDISIAIAYLEFNGYSLETIFDYIAMLKYSSPQRHPKGVFPPPLEALQIPDNAIENKEIDNMAQKLLKNGMLWILAHELGHIVHRHKSSDEITNAQSIKNETEADLFAIECFRRNGLGPYSMVIIFSLFVHFDSNSSDYGSSYSPIYSATTHPFSYDRLQGIANEIRKSPSDFLRFEPDKSDAYILTTADEIDELANIYRDPSIQDILHLRGLTITTQSLTPRRGEDIFASFKKQFISTDRDLTFQGLYKGFQTRNLLNGKQETLRTYMLLNRNGPRVVGRFNFGLGEGRIDGVVSGKNLILQWNIGDISGKGNIQDTNEKSLSGEWGYDVSETGGGTWSFELA